MARILDPNTIGPVDVALVVFEGNNFTGDVAPALAELNDSGIVHIIDLAFISKDADGTTTVLEVEDADVSDAFSALTGDQLDLLNEDDLDLMADDLEPDTSALVIVWENSWAARIGAAIRGSGGYLVGMQRIPADVVATALEVLADETEEGEDA
jgi:hypothetical protein